MAKFNGSIVLRQYISLEKLFLQRAYFNKSFDINGWHTIADQLGIGKERVGILFYLKKVESEFDDKGEMDFLNAIDSLISDVTATVYYGLKIAVLEDVTDEGRAVKKVSELNKASSNIMLKPDLENFEQLAVLASFESEYLLLN